MGNRVGNVRAGGRKQARRLLGSRHPARRAIVIAVAVTVGVLGSLALAGISGATGPSKGSNIPGAAAAVGSFTTGPFDSGQQVNIVVPANSVLAPNQTFFILECAAPNGVDPTTINECDGNTNYAHGTPTTNADGSINLQAAGKKLYTIYALPDHTTLGEFSANGATCGVGAANECVLYIGQGGGSDIGLSQPYFFSQPFQVHSDPTDSGTSSPGDGSPAAAAPVSASLSTVTPPTQSVAADGHDPATVTVTVKDTNSVGVAGKAVSLTAGSGSSTVVANTSGGVTDANGQVSFTVTDSTPESVTYTAEDTTDSIPLTATAQVTYSPETVNTLASSLSADPTSVPADGTTASTVTVVLRDQPVNGQPQPMVGRTVTLAGESGSAAIAPASGGSNVTNSSGQATFSVTDTQNEVVTFKATDTTDSVTLTSTATVTFGAQAPVSASASTVTASPSPASTGVGGGTTVTVTLETAAQNPVPGKSVTLSATSPSGLALVSVNPVVTDSNGQAKFTVTDSHAESVTISAVDTSDANLKLDASPVVVFKAPPPPSVSPTNSQVIVSGSPEPADGLSEAIVEVVVENTTGADVSGATVSVAVSPSGTAIATPIASGGAAPGVTDAQGVTTFGVHDTAAETVAMTATVTTSAGSVPLSSHPTAAFFAGPPNATVSTVSANPAQVATGTASSTVTVTLKDYFGNPVQGDSVTLNQGSAGSVISPPTATTDARGVANFTVSDATNEVVDYTATDTTAGLNVAQQASVIFGTAPIVKPVMGDSDVVANASKVPADGKTNAIITVQLRDANGHPVTEKTMSLSASGGSSVIKSGTSSTTSATSVAPSAVGSKSESQPHASGPTVVTNSNGVAVFDATDTVAEAVTYTADDQTDSMSGWKVTVTFTAATVTTTTTSTTTSTTTTTAPAVTADTSSAPAQPSEGGGAGTGSSGSATDTGTGTSASTNPDLAFTGAPSALPWLFGGGLVLLLLGFLGRRLLLARKRES